MAGERNFSGTLTPQLQILARIKHPTDTVGKGVKRAHAVVLHAGIFTEDFPQFLICIAEAYRAIDRLIEHPIVQTARITGCVQTDFRPPGKG